jgi:hypothetical protein
MIDIGFKFRPVGQGAFYSGIFKHRSGKQFSFVYDCGTHSSRQYIDQEIGKFVLETDYKQIDVLVISHFHDDHINRLTNLLTQTGGAKYAILPYLTPDELILAYSDATLSGADSDTLSFIQNPVNFLTERNVEKIIYIHPDDESGSGDTDNPNIKEIDPESPDFDFILQNELKPHPQSDINNSVSHFYDTGKLALVGFWEFKFFNKPRTPSIIANFNRDIKELLKIDDLSFADIANYIEDNKTTFASKFNKVYSDNFGARQLINDTSIVIYHGPLTVLDRYHRRYFRNHTERYIWRWDSPGTILTGDINFDQNCCDNMRLKWVNPIYNIDVGIFQIPHHGAESYLQDSIFNHYPQVNFWVINFGLGNKHKHPRQNIVDMIESNKLSGKIFENTQVSRFNYGCRYR